MAVLSLCCQASIGEEFRVNGARISVERAVVRGDLREFAAALTRRWRAATPTEPIVRRDSPGRIVLARRSGSRFQSVEISSLPDARRIALTSTLTDLESASRRVPEVPLLPAIGLRLASVVEVPGATPAIVFSGSSRLTVTALAAAASRAAGVAGWLPAKHGGPMSSAAAQRIWLRGTQSLVLRLFPDAGGSRFVLTQHRAASSGN